MHRYRPGRLRQTQTQLRLFSRSSVAAQVWKRKHKFLKTGLGQQHGCHGLHALTEALDPPVFFFAEVLPHANRIKPPPVDGVRLYAPVTRPMQALRSYNAGLVAG